MPASRDLMNPEPLLALAAILVALLAAAVRFRGLGFWMRPLARVAGRRWWSIVVAASFPLALRFLLLPRFPVPEPRIHDEFSFLLGASTLFNGRLANPQHPMWVHFESMHILSRPCYASAFPLGQGALLALGRLFGHPWIGVWLSIGLMCGAICWMLQGWVPARWALLGALLVGIRLGVSSYWMNSYYGGALAATGGVLVLGTLARLRSQPRWPSAALMGIGLFMLACSRTFEGSVYGLIIGAAVAGSVLGKRRPQWGVAVRQIVLPLSVMLAVTVGGMAIYFARVTGSPWTPPYLLYRSTVTQAPHFLWQTPRPAPLYNNREMRQFYSGIEMNDFYRARREPVAELFGKLAFYWRFYLGPLLSLPLLVLPWLWKDKEIRRLLMMIFGFALALAGQVWHNAHYAAPGLGLFILLVVLCMRHVSVWRWRGWTGGRVLIQVQVLACLTMLLVQIVMGPGPLDEKSVAGGWRWRGAAWAGRASILRQLQDASHDGRERHLVLVRYGSTHDTGAEWVYNEADIDASRVVWARELDRFSNAKLITYFQGRRTWLVEPDLAVPRLVPYERAEGRPMPFVALGAPGIAVLQSPQEVGRKVRAATTANRLTCDQWNYHFTEVTGVEGPDVNRDCHGGERGLPVDFERYFDWLQNQR